LIGTIEPLDAGAAGKGRSTFGFEKVANLPDRRDRWRREGERSIGQNLAMIGALGWTIVLPTLLGIFAGRWLDRIFATGIFWTLGLLVAGLAAGCALAWQRMYRE
jgi:ATP synthase protein I